MAACSFVFYSPHPTEDYIIFEQCPVGIFYAAAYLSIGIPCSSLALQQQQQVTLGTTVLATAALQDTAAQALLE